MGNYDWRSVLCGHSSKNKIAQGMDDTKLHCHFGVRDFPDFVRLRALRVVGPRSRGLQHCDDVELLGVSPHDRRSYSAIPKTVNKFRVTSDEISDFE
jgi:hypothetical protein